MRIAARLGSIFITALLTIGCVPPETQVSPQRIEAKKDWVKNYVVPSYRVVYLAYSPSAYKFTTRYTSDNNTTISTDDIWGPVWYHALDPVAGAWVSVSISPLPRDGWNQSAEGECDLTLEVYVDGELFKTESTIGWSASPSAFFTVPYQHRNARVAPEGVAPPFPQ